MKKIYLSLSLCLVFAVFALPKISLAGTEQYDDNVIPTNVGNGVGMYPVPNASISPAFAAAPKLKVSDLTACPAPATDAVNGVVQVNIIINGQTCQLVVSRVDYTWAQLRGIYPDGLERSILVGNSDGLVTVHWTGLVMNDTVAQPTTVPDQQSRFNNVGPVLESPKQVFQDLANEAATGNKTLTQWKFFAGATVASGYPSTVVNAPSFTVPGNSMDAVLTYIDTNANYAC